MPASLAIYQKNKRVLKLDTSYLSLAEVSRYRCHIWDAIFGTQGRLVSSKCLRDPKGYGGNGWFAIGFLLPKGASLSCPRNRALFNQGLKVIDAELNTLVRQ